MSASKFDKDLFLGILACQEGMISQNELLDGLKAWTGNKDSSLREILARQNAIPNNELNRLEALVESQLSNVDDSKLLELTHQSELVDTIRALDNPELDSSIVFLSSMYNRNDDEKTDHPTGRNAGRFEVIRPHARGGLGEVFVARDTELNREVALKEIQSQHAFESEKQRRFVLEAEITGGLEHPGIVPVYGLGKYSDGRPYYAMRFIEGDSLGSAIKDYHGQTDSATQKNIEFRSLLRHFIDVCEAMGYAHSRGVIHRDLKPSNIMLGKYGETLVVDWGLAKSLGTHSDENSDAEQEFFLRPSSSTLKTLDGLQLGTPAYMSPEQARGDIANMGPQTDIFAMGATLYHILSGQAPQTGKTLEQVLIDVAAGNFESPRTINETVSRELEAVCLKAMATNPADRYASIGELSADIERFLGDEAVSAMPDPWAAKAGRWVRKNRRSVAAICCATLLLIAGLSGFAIFFSIKNDILEKGLYLSLCYLSGQVLTRGGDAALDRIFEDGFEAISKDLRSWEYGYLDKLRDAELKTIETIDFKKDNIGLESAKISPDLKFLVTIEVNGNVTAWDLNENGKKIWEFNETKDATAFAAISNDYIALAWSKDNHCQLELRDFKSNKPLFNKTLAEQPTCVKFSRSGKQILTAEKNAQQSTDEDPQSTVRLWNLDLTQLDKLEVPMLRVDALEFSPNDRLLAIGGQGKRDAELKDRGRERGRWFVHELSKDRDELGDRKQQGWTQYVVTAMAFPPIAGQLYIGQKWGLVARVLFDSNSESDVPFGIWEHELGVNAIAVPNEEANGTTSFPNALVAIGGNDRFITLDSTTGYRRISGHRTPVVGLRFSTDSKQLVSVGSSGNVRFWSTAKTQNQIVLFNSEKPAYFKCIQFSKSGQLVAAGGKDKTAGSSGLISLWNRKYDHIKTVNVPGDDIRIVKFSPTENHLLTIANDGIASLIDLSTFEIQEIKSDVLVTAGDFVEDRILLGLEDGRLQSFALDGTLKATWVSHDAPISNVIVSRTNTVAYTVARDIFLRNKNRQFWNRTVQRNFRRISFNDSGSMLAGSTGGFSKNEHPGSVYVWYSKDGSERLHLEPWEDLEAGVDQVVFTPDDKRLIISGQDYATHVFRMSDGLELFGIWGINGAFVDGAISSDGLVYGSCEEDGVLTLREAKPWN